MSLRTVDGPRHQLAVWLTKAFVAAAGTFALGIVLMGWPGAALLELVLAMRPGSRLPPATTMPLSLLVTAGGSLMIVPASLYLRYCRPNLAPWAHVASTAALALAGAVLLAAALVWSCEIPQADGRRGAVSPISTRVSFMK